MSEFRYSSANWFGKASAGTLLGFTLALGLSGVFAWFGPGEIGYFSAQSQFTMWLMSPLWATILCACFMFRSGRRAWLWLGGANLLVWGLLLAARPMLV